MLQNFINTIPSDFIKFFLVVLFSLLIGLEQQRQNSGSETGHLGTARTFILIALLGYMLLAISPKGDYGPFMYGGLVVSALMLVNYWWKIAKSGEFGLSQIIVALITYCITPMVYYLPNYLTLLIIICILMVTEIKDKLVTISEKMHRDELISLAKFLAISGVILPLLPHEPLSEYIDISPYKFWLTVVIVSGISYSSYLVKKFIFPTAGPLLTGVLGGMYSSTSTTIILAKKSKENASVYQNSAAILVATAMMYIRILILAFIFNREIALYLTIPFAICTIIALGLTYFFYQKGKNEVAEKSSTLDPNANINPLEFKTALFFSVLFIVFAFVTSYVKGEFGSSGISVLAFIVGLSDIDPFLVSIFQGKLAEATTTGVQVATASHKAGVAMLAIATLNAVASNNCMKCFYAITLGDKTMKKNLIIGFGLLVAAGLISTVFLSLL